MLADVEHLRDVGVVEARGDARLVEEHRLEAPLGGELLADRLDGDELLEPVLALQAPEPDRAHAAAGHVADHVVPIDPRTDRKLVGRAQELVGPRRTS